MDSQDKPRLDVDRIYKDLQAMRNVGWHEPKEDDEGPRAEIASPLINAILGVERKWSSGQCEFFFEKLLEEYCPPDHLENMRAVSGLEEEYRNITKATVRRRKFFNNNKGKGLFRATKVDSLRTDESNVLKVMAVKIQTDFESGKLKRFASKLFSEVSVVEPTSDPEPEATEPSPEPELPPAAELPPEPQSVPKAAPEAAPKLELELPPEPQPEPVNPQPWLESPSGPGPDQKPDPEPPSGSGSDQEPDPRTESIPDHKLNPGTGPKPDPDQKPDDDNTKINTGTLGNAPTTDFPKVNKRLKAVLIAGITFIALLAVVIIGGIIYLYNYDFTYTVNLQERFDDYKTWNDELDNVRIGDVIEFQFEFKNDRSLLSSALLKLGDKLGLSMTAENVMIRFILPNNLEYVEGSTVLYNSDLPDGATVLDDTVTTDGINIGRYAINGNGYIRIKCRVMNNNLSIGRNEIVIWANATVAGKVEKDSVKLFLTY